jgi:DNA gyrase/topoisomerase IV subunit B
MEQGAHEKNSRQRLIESIFDLGGKAFNPETSETSRVQAKAEFDDLIQRQAKLFGPPRAISV